jgi:hypothetical protein
MNITDKENGGSNMKKEMLRRLYQRERSKSRDKDK